MWNKSATENYTSQKAEKNLNFWDFISLKHFTEIMTSKQGLSIGSFKWFRIPYLSPKKHTKSSVKYETWRQKLILSSRYFLAIGIPGKILKTEKWKKNSIFRNFKKKVTKILWEKWPKKYSSKKTIFDCENYEFKISIFRN